MSPWKNHCHTRVTAPRWPLYPWKVSPTPHRLPSSHSLALKAPQAKLGTWATGSRSASQAVSRGAGSHPCRCPALLWGADRIPDRSLRLPRDPSGPTGALRPPRIDPAPSCNSNPIPAPPAPRRPLTPPMTQEVTELPQNRISAAEVACLPVSPAGPPSCRDKAFPAIDSASAQPPQVLGPAWPPC